MASGAVLGGRLMASLTEKCWMPSVALVTIGPFGPLGRLSAHGAHVPRAAAPATPAAAPRNPRRSMRTSSLILCAPPSYHASDDPRAAQHASPRKPSTV